MYSRESPNVFLLGATTPESEDRFTSLLHYLIDSNREIGQGIVDTICNMSGLPNLTFERAEDHPGGDLENQPDFLLSCTEGDILCEHKLNSSLGPNQLERYLKLPVQRKSVPTYLVLITNKWIAVSDDLIGGKQNRYLHPQNPPRQCFFWQDFYEVIASNQTRLAQDFAKYMRSIFMNPPSGAFADVFTNPIVARDLFETTTTSMQKYFRDLGMKFSGVSKVGFSFGVYDPKDRIPYLYFSATRELKPAIEGIESPFLICELFVREGQFSKVQPYLKETEVQTHNGVISGQALNEKGFDASSVCCYRFVGNLNGYDAESRGEIQDRLLMFAKTVFEQTTGFLSGEHGLCWNSGGVQL